VGGRFCHIDDLGLHGLDSLYLLYSLADGSFDDLDALYDLCVPYREGEDDDEQRIEKEQQEHESLLAVQAQLFL
jgi:hypothetical protein